jgi:hypothetical protein
VLDSVGQVAAARSVWLVRDDKFTDRKLFLPIKANLSGDLTGLAFRIVNGIVEYEPDPIEMDGMESWTPTRQTPRLDEAVEWLEDSLADGPVKSAEILEMAKGSGISEDTLRRAKDELGVIVSKVGNEQDGCWFWTLPEKEVQC